MNIRFFFFCFCVLFFSLYKLYAFPISIYNFKREENMTEQFNLIVNNVLSQNTDINEESLKDILKAGTLATAIALSPASKAGELPAKVPIEQKATKSEKVKNYKLSQIQNIVAYTIWQEARGEGETGMRAVASVIYNRAGGHHPYQFVNVIKKPKQFESWSHLSPKQWLPQNYTNQVVKKDLSQWRTANKIAYEMITGEFKPLDSEINHFYNPDVVTPSWSIGREKKKFGENPKHVFLSIKA